jgi:tetratricopeptide (TPR) repeat protein
LSGSDIVTVHLEQGKALYGLGRYKDARYAYKQAIQRDLNIASAYAEQGRALVEKGKAVYDRGLYEEACAIYKQAILFYPTSASAYAYLGKALYELGRYQDARNAYKQAIYYDSSYAAAYTNLNLGDLEQGEEAKTVLPVAPTLDTREDYFRRNKHWISDEPFRYE